MGNQSSCCPDPDLKNERKSSNQLLRNTYSYNNYTQNMSDKQQTQSETISVQTVNTNTLERPKIQKFPENNNLQNTDLIQTDCSYTLNIEKSQLKQEKKTQDHFFSYQQENEDSDSDSQQFLSFEDNELNLSFETEEEQKVNNNNEIIPQNKKYEAQNSNDIFNDNDNNIKYLQSITEIISSSFGTSKLENSNISKNNQSFRISSESHFLENTRISFVEEECLTQIELQDRIIHIDQLVCYNFTQKVESISFYVEKKPKRCDNCQIGHAFLILNIRNEYDQIQQFQLHAYKNKKDIIFMILKEFHDDIKESKYTFQARENIKLVHIFQYCHQFWIDKKYKLITRNCFHFSMNIIQSFGRFQTPEQENTYYAFIGKWQVQLSKIVKNPFKSLAKIKKSQPVFPDIPQFQQIQQEQHSKEQN